MIELNSILFKKKNIIFIFIIVFHMNINSLLLLSFSSNNSATVAQEYSKFWVGIESPVINVVSRNVPIQPSYGVTTRRPPFKQAIPNYAPPSNDQYVSLLL